MGIAIALMVMVLLGAASAWWLIRWRRALVEQEQARWQNVEKAESSELDHLRQEFSQLTANLYQSDQSIQCRVGKNLNLALAHFQSLYTSTRVFEAVSHQRQQEFLNKLTEAELIFYEQGRQEEGSATTLFKCWLTAVVAGDRTAAEEFHIHLDYFRCLPLADAASSKHRAA